MRTYVLATLTAALFVLPTSAFSQVGVEIGPGGVYVDRGTATTMMAIARNGTMEGEGVRYYGRWKA